MIQILKNGCGPGTVELLGLGIVLKPLSHIPYVYVVSVKNKIQTIIIIC